MPRQRPDPERAQEFVLVEQARQHAAQAFLAEQRQQPPVVIPGPSRIVNVGDQVRAVVDEPAGALLQLGQRRHHLFAHDRRGAQREQTHHRPHLQLLGASVGRAQDVVEEPVLLVPHLALAADVDHRRRDPDEVLEELQRHVDVGTVVERQLQRDLQHRLRVERHPGRAVRLFQMAAGGQRRAAIDDTDVVEAEEPALEHVPPGGILAIDPPGEVEQQLVVDAAEELQIGVAGAAPVDLVEEVGGPRVHGRIHVAEVPLVRRHLSGRMQVPLLQQEQELLLREVRIDERQRNASGRRGPRPRTAGTPTCPASR